MSVQSSSLSWGFIATGANVVALGDEIYDICPGAAGLPSGLGDTCTASRSKDDSRLGVVVLPHRTHMERKPFFLPRWLRALATCRPPRNSCSSATTGLSHTSETGPVRALPIVPIFDRRAGCGPFHLHVLAQNMSWLNPQKIRALRTSTMAFPTRSLTTCWTVSGNLSQSHARPFAHNPTAERDPACTAVFPACRDKITVTGLRM